MVDGLWRFVLAQAENEQLDSHKLWEQISLNGMSALVFASEPEMTNC